MGKKTITMSYDDYQMMSIDNEFYKRQYEELKDEKKVYLTTINRSPFQHQISGQIVEKDELLKTMREHLEASVERTKKLEAEYRERIDKLTDALHQASINQAESIFTRWWHKLLK